LTQPEIEENHAKLANFRHFETASSLAASNSDTSRWGTLRTEVASVIPAQAGIETETSITGFPPARE
jgi:hypothetical protein